MNRHMESSTTLPACAGDSVSRGPRPIRNLTPAERLNFLLTNRIPRQALTRFMGWYSKLENPLLAATSIRLWQAFVDDLRLEEAESQDFSSLHACFTRRLKPGARPLDPRLELLLSPCDAVIGEHGPLEGLQAIQAKGFPYGIGELLGDAADAERYRRGSFVTLRLKSSMYHRFHAPAAGRVGTLRYLSGDTWNVNPVALKVVERLFCRNERVVFPFTLADGGQQLTIVAVAAVLVASIRIRGLNHPLDLAYRGPRHIDLNRDYARGEEMGHFEHGSTLVVLAPPGFRLSGERRTGQIVRMGQPLLQPVD